MPQPTTAAGKLVLDELTALSKAANFRAGDFKALRGLKANLKELESLKKASNALKSGLSNVSKTTKETASLYKDLNKRANELKKGVDASKNLWDKFLEKIPGKGGQVGKAGAAGGSLAALLVIGGAAAISLIGQWLQNQVNDGTFKTLDEIYKEMLKQDKLIYDNAGYIKGLQEREKQTKVQINDIKEKLYLQDVLNDFLKKKTNDALYETREGRRKLQEQIDAQKQSLAKFKNDITYEIRETGRKLREQVDGITSKANDAIKQANDTIKQVNTKIQEFNSRQDTLKKDITLSVTEKVKGDISDIRKQQSADKANTESQFKNIQSLIGERFASIQKQINEQGFTSREIEALINRELDKKLATADAKTKADIDAFRKALNNEINKAEFERDRVKNQIQSILLDKNKTAELEQKFIDLGTENKKSQGILEKLINDAKASSVTADNALATRINEAEANRQRGDIALNDRINNLENQAKNPPIPPSIDKRISSVENKDNELFTLITNINGRVAAVDKYSQETRYLVTRQNDKIVSVLQNVNGRLEQIDRETYEKIKPQLERNTRTIISSTIQPQIDTLKDVDKGLTKEIGVQATKVREIEKELEKTIKPDIKKLDTRIKEREKVDKEANDKLGQILGLVGLIPGIPAKAGNFITPKLITPDQVQAATGRAMCRNLQTGCGRRAIDDAVGRVNQNSNQNKSDLLNKLNAGAQIPELALLGVINNKLGAQLPGGLSRVIGSITRNQAINQIANLVTMAAAIHNVIQLSDNAAVTFFGILDNLFAIPSLIINPEGDTIDTREVFNGAIENVMKSVFGVQEWAEIKAKWAAYNRIYQAAANSLDEIRNIGSSLGDAISTTATLTGRGFNALQNDGILSEYNWEPTPENLRLKGGIFGKLGKLADGISAVNETLEAIESVTSEIRSAVESANQIKQNTVEMEEEVKKLLGEETKKRDEAIKAIEAPTFNYEDLF